ncbi:MAG: DUF2974 domain-containing protein [Spirochaetaceae bacterium]|nr:DUF2974 domain-containing protein [Spirochaetaceae bacterium]
MVKDEQNDIFFSSSSCFKEFQREFFKKLMSSSRYKDICIAGFVNKFDKEREMQFSAVTIFPKGAHPYIAFRGTDSTLVGWKEDFNMALNDIIPAQTEAKLYVSNASKKIWGKFYVGGHSKGGNLAIYAATCVPVKIQRRIVKIFSNDGPGFQQNFFKDINYKRIKNKIEAFIPQSSIIGLLFERDYNINVIESSVQGFMQHNMYTWQVCPDDFVYAHDVTDKALALNKAVMSWINSMDISQREKFIETLYEAVNTTDINTIPDFAEDWFHNTGRLIRTFIKMKPESKKILVHTISDFISSMKKHKCESSDQKCGERHD